MRLPTPVPIELDLVEQGSFESGVTVHLYALGDGSEVNAC
jgi:hypothetical protein